MTFYTRVTWAEDCLAKLICPSGYAENSDPYPARYPELFRSQNPTYVNYCEKVTEKNISHPIHDSPVVGFDSKCRVMFKGQYHGEKEAGTWTVYRPDGSVMETIIFSKGSQSTLHLFTRPRPSRPGAAGARSQSTLHLFTPSGEPIHFDVDPDGVVGSLGSSSMAGGKGPEPGRTYKFSTGNVQQVDSSEYLEFVEPMVHVCASTADLAFNLDNIDSIFSNHFIDIQFKGATKRAALYLSSPKYADKHDSASFYYFSITGSSCHPSQEKTTCDIDVTANKLDAPVKDGVILLSASKRTDDELTRELGHAAEKSIQSATIWCDWIPARIRSFLPNHPLFDH
jgi:hypothetical protein